MATALILLIATAPDTAGVWRSALEQAGLTVLHVAAGLDGVRDALERRPDVIVLDFAAEDAADVMRARGALRRAGVKLLVLAQGHVAEEAAQGEDAIRFLRKPFTTEQLVTEVVRLATTGRRPGRPAGQGTGRGSS